MFGLVLAACLAMPETRIAPSYTNCSLVLKHEQFKTKKECEQEATEYGIKVHKLNKSLTITGYKCIDMSTVDISPTKPETNPIDPKLKPLTPEQQHNDYKSM